MFDAKKHEPWQNAEFLIKKIAGIVQNSKKKKADRVRVLAVVCVWRCVRVRAVYSYVVPGPFNFNI